MIRGEGAARRSRPAALPDWSLATMVHTLQALRGMALVAEQRSSPMLTECSPTLFEFAPVAGRQVVAGFRRRSDHFGCWCVAAG